MLSYLLCSTRILTPGGVSNASFRESHVMLNASCVHTRILWPTTNVETDVIGESLHSLYVSYYSLQSYSSSTEMLHSLYVSYYSLQSYGSSTGDATQSIRFLLFALQEMLHSLYVSYYSLYRRCYTVYTFPTVPCRATVALQEMLHSLCVSYYSLQSYSGSTGDATQSIRFLLSSTGDATQSIRFLLLLRSYSSSTGDATLSIRFLLFPVEPQQLYRRCYTVYTFPTIPCRATVALQEMLHSLYVSYYSLQSYSSPTGDATQSIRFLLFPVELQQLYRRCYTVYTSPTIPCRATVALQEMLHSLYVSYYCLQIYSSSTGDATQSIRSLLFPVELQQLYRRCYTVYTFPTIPCRATVALQEMLHSLYVSYYSLWRYSSSTGDATQSIRFLLFPVELQQLYTGYSSSTGDATQSIRFLLFPVELQQLYKRCYTVYTFPTIPCRATVALQEMLHSLYVSYCSLYRCSSSTGNATQEMLHSLYVSYYSLATQSIRFLYSLQSYSSSTGDATQSICFLLLPVEIQQLYRRCYTVYTVPTIPCRATVALQEMLHSLYVSYYSLQSHSSSTGDATQSIRFLLFPCRATVALQEMLHSLCVSYYSLQSFCYTLYTFPTIPCRATVALQEMLHSLYVSQSYWRCYPVYTFPTIPCRATVALQEMLHSLYVSYYSLQSYSSSTGDATQSIRSLLFLVELQQLYRRCYTVYTFLLFPVELQQLYRRCYTVYTFPTIPCRATVALQEMLHSLYVSYCSLQSYSSSTGDATQSMRFLMFPVELQQLYRRCYTVYTFPTIPCRDTVALQEMLSSTGDATQLSIRFLLFPVALQQLYRRCYTVYTSPAVPCILFPVELQQLYRRCYRVYTFPTIPCRATAALQEMLHSLYVSYYSLQSYSSSTRDATPSIRFLLVPVGLQQLYRRCYTVYTFPTIPCTATVLQLCRRCYTVFTFPTIR